MRTLHTCRSIHTHKHERTRTHIHEHTHTCPVAYIHRKSPVSRGQLHLMATASQPPANSEQSSTPAWKAMSAEHDIQGRETFSYQYQVRLEILQEKNLRYKWFCLFTKKHMDQGLRKSEKVPSSRHRYWGLISQDIREREREKKSQWSYQPAYSKTKAQGGRTADGSVTDWRVDCRSICSTLRRGAHINNQEKATEETTANGQGIPGEILPNKWGSSTKYWIEEPLAHQEWLNDPQMILVRHWKILQHSNPMRRTHDAVALFALHSRPFANRGDGSPLIEEILFLGLPASRVAAMKNFAWCTVENVVDFSWSCLRPFPWKLKNENLRKKLPNFRSNFRQSLAKFSQELRCGGLRWQPFRELEL